MIIDFRCKKNDQLMFEIDVPIKHLSINFVLDYDCKIPGGWWLWITNLVSGIWDVIQVLLVIGIVGMICSGCIGICCLYPASTVIIQFSKFRS
jgi:hypothetical protein